MTEYSKKVNANPIIEAARSRAEGKVQKLAGYLGAGEGGKIELYLSLDMEICLEFDEQEILHIIEPEKPTEPSLVFVRDQARITVRREISAASAAALMSPGCDCGGDTTSKPGIIAIKNGGGGTTGNPDLDCLLRKLACETKCWIKHGDDPLLEQACEDSCAAAGRLCRSTSPFGDGLGIFLI